MSSLAPQVPAALDEIDLSRISVHLDSIGEQLDDLLSAHAEFVTDGGGTSKSERRARRTDLSQRTMRLADDLSLLSAMARQAYWRLRDQPPAGVPAPRTRDASIRQELEV